MRTGVSMFFATLLAVAVGTAAAEVAVTTAATPSSADVNGSWSGTWTYQHPEQGGGIIVSSFQQTGDKLSGNLTMFGTVGRDYTVVGYVKGNQITLSQPTVGSLTINGDEITGFLEGWDNARVSLRKQ